MVYGYHKQPTYPLRVRSKAMVCHTVEFVMAELSEKPYFPERMSPHLVEQMKQLDCDDFSRVLRAIDGSEKGDPSTKRARVFATSGVLAGYGHIHRLRKDWVAGNFASINGMSVTQPIGTSIEEKAEEIVVQGGDAEILLEKTVKKFSKRMRSATGDWVVYKDTSVGRIYLTLSEHVDSGSSEEHALRALLDEVGGQFN